MASRQVFHLGLAIDLDRALLDRGNVNLEGRSLAHFAGHV